MSGDEGFVFILSLGTALFLWSAWVFQALRVRVPRPEFWWLRLAAIVVPVACGVSLYWVLRNHASHDVRDSTTYLAFYMIMGMAWLGGAVRMLHLFGLHTRDDIFERGNSAAAIAICGALFGLTFCFAGGNVGDGPGWWVVIFSALLSTGTFFALWCSLDKITRVTDAITIDRDRASGLRVAAYFIANGAVLGRAVAGNWVSALATLRDFVLLAWPVLLLTAIAVVIELILRPTPHQPQRSTFLFGVPVLLAFVAAALCYLWITSR
jgi:hypothetical protein